MKHVEVVDIGGNGACIEDWIEARETYSDGRVFSYLVGGPEDTVSTPSELFEPSEQLSKMIEDGLKEPSPGGELPVLDKTPDHEITRMSFTRYGVTYEIFHGKLRNRKTGEWDRVSAGVSREDWVKGVNEARETGREGWDYEVEVDTFLDSRHGFVNVVGVNSKSDERTTYPSHLSPKTPNLAKALVNVTFHALRNPAPRVVSPPPLT